MLVREGLRHVRGTPARLRRVRDSVPGCFDLVVANHLLTHAVHPRDRWPPSGSVWRRAVTSISTTSLTKRTSSRRASRSFNTLNAFHLQTFDGAALARALQSAGFEPVYIGHYHDNCVALARVAPDGAVGSHLEEGAREARSQVRTGARPRYPLPSRAVARCVRSEWDAVVQRAFAAKSIDFDGDGNLRILKRSCFSHLTSHTGARR